MPHAPAACESLASKTHRICASLMAWHPVMNRSPMACMSARRCPSISCGDMPVGVGGADVGGVTRPRPGIVTVGGSILGGACGADGDVTSASRRSTILSRACAHNSSFDTVDEQPAATHTRSREPRQRSRIRTPPSRLALPHRSGCTRTEVPIYDPLHGSRYTAQGFAGSDSERSAGVVRESTDRSSADGCSRWRLLTVVVTASWRGSIQILPNRRRPLERRCLAGRSNRGRRAID